MALVSVVAACGDDKGPTSAGTTSTTGMSTTAGATEPDCGSGCAPAQDCAPGGGSDGAGTEGDDGCAAGEHCEDRSVCCEQLICLPDCDPDDPSTCPPGTTCDAASGECV